MNMHSFLIVIEFILIMIAIAAVLYFAYGFSAISSGLTALLVGMFSSWLTYVQVKWLDMN